jgi:hypothetical protein
MANKVKPKSNAAQFRKQTLLYDTLVKEAERHSSPKHLFYSLGPM